MNDASQDCTSSMWAAVSKAKSQNEALLQNKFPKENYK